MIGALSYLYQFQFGTSFFYFNNENEIITYLGQDYLPVAIKHDPPEQSAEEISGDLVITMDYTEEDASDFVLNFVSIAPAGLTLVTVFEYDYGASPLDPSVVAVWNGNLSSTSFDDDGKVSLLCQPFSSLWRREGPRMNWGTLCNHEFTDVKCTVAAATFSILTTPVSAVASNGLDITIPGILTSPLPADQTYRGGKLAITANPIDARLIVAQVGAVVTIQYGFRELPPTTNVNVLQGCDHRLRTCKDKFNNLPNFGGTPFYSTANPFEVGFDRLLDEKLDAIIS